MSGPELHLALALLLLLRTARPLSLLPLTQVALPRRHRLPLAPLVLPHPLLETLSLATLFVSQLPYILILDINIDLPA